MKKILIPVLLFIQISGFGKTLALVNLYVSPNGSDQWSGTFPSANKAGTDGPFKTLQKAKLKVEELNKSGQAKDGIVVMLRKGVYEMDESFILNKDHSGRKGAPMVWKNYNNEKVQLIGGKEITGFKPITDVDILKRIKDNFQKKILQLNLKVIGINDYGTITKRGRPGLELFFNGEKMTLARWPNQGWDTVAGVPQSGELAFQGDSNHLINGVPTGRHFGRINYKGDRQLAGRM